MDRTFFQQKFCIFLYILYIPADNQSFSHVENSISLHVLYIFSTWIKTLIERGLRPKCRDVEKIVKFRISFGITESRQSGKYKSKVSLTNKQIRQGDFVNSSRRVCKLVKEFSSKPQGLFRKALHLF